MASPSTSAYGTAMGMLERAEIRAGEWLLVTGASGGVGLALVQLAAARGARVVAVTSAAKADLVRAAGAMGVVTRESSNLAGQVAEMVPSGLDAAGDSTLRSGKPGATRDPSRHPSPAPQQDHENTQIRSVAKPTPTPSAPVTGFLSKAARPKGPDSFRC